MGRFLVFSLYSNETFVSLFPMPSTRIKAARTPSEAHAFSPTIGSRPSGKASRAFIVCLNIENFVAARLSTGLFDLRRVLNLRYRVFCVRFAEADRFSVRLWLLKDCERRISGRKRRQGQVIGVGCKPIPRSSLGRLNELADARDATRAL